VEEFALAITRNRLQSHIADLKDTIWYLESRVGWFTPDEIEAVNNWIGLLKQKLAESCDDLRELDQNPARSRGLLFRFRNNSRNSLTPEKERDIL
jgi:hypothetical protein